jgi:hypothetical protein
MEARLHLSDEERADIRREVVEQLRAELRGDRARILEDLFLISAEEFAILTGMCLESAKGRLTSWGISKVHLGERTIRYPLREVKRKCDALAIKRVMALREERKAA